MTESEVPQGNQDGQSSLPIVTYSYTPTADGRCGACAGYGYYFLSSTELPTPTKQTCGRCQGSGNDLSAADLGHTEGTNTSQSSGSQDSIDSLDAMLDAFYDLMEQADNRDLCGREGADSYREEAHETAKERLTAWHNTQLKASIPEKIAGCSEHPWGSEDCTRWFECPMIYGHNRAIDLMQAKWGKA